MHILLLGATGNLGRRLIPALLVHGHQVTAYVRSASRLLSLIPASLVERISIYEGDALDSQAVESALRQHNCNAIVQTSGTRLAGKEQELGRMASSISAAAMRVGKDRGRTLRAWFIGGLGSLEYPRSGGGQIQDYLPDRMTRHHRETEEALKAISTSELEWSLLCVAFMKPESEVVEDLTEPRRHQLIVRAGVPPEWQDSWFSYLPFVGSYLNVFLNIAPYQTKLENVADMIAEDFDGGSESESVGQLVGMKESRYRKIS